jgi:hypothetical protein
MVPSPDPMLGSGPEKTTPIIISRIFDNEQARKKKKNSRRIGLKVDIRRQCSDQINNVSNFGIESKDISPCLGLVQCIYLYVDFEQGDSCILLLGINYRFNLAGGRKSVRA